MGRKQILRITEEKLYMFFNFILIERVVAS